MDLRRGKLRSPVAIAVASFIKFRIAEFVSDEVVASIPDFKADSIRSSLHRLVDEGILYSRKGDGRRIVYGICPPESRRHPIDKFRITDELLDAMSRITVDKLTN